METGFNLLRLVARRDPTTATALIITSLAFLPAWIAGTAEQKQYLVDAMKQGSRYAWGLSERNHGSDVLGNELRADKVDGGYLLTGEKWLIGNARVADGLTVFARTKESGGPAATRSCCWRSAAPRPAPSRSCPTSGCTACAPST
ncbi:acyl-CoA dehydrogenase family protein [Kitasatospora arboriphila]